MGIGCVNAFLVGSVTAKVRNLAPSAANRWSDDFLRSMIHVADLILCEQAEVNWQTRDIALTATATYFAVPTNCVWVGAVLYSEDGTTFNDGVLWPTTMNELDQIDPNWQNTTGTKPTHFFLLSTPGTDGARIAIYPQMSSVTAQAIRLKYMACRPDVDLTFTILSVPERIEDIYYVPMVLALIYGSFDANQAAENYGRAMHGLNIVRGAYASRRDDVFQQNSPESPAGGQFA